jgi:hypothetical protein
MIASNHDCAEQRNHRLPEHRLLTIMLWKQQPHDGFSGHSAATTPATAEILRDLAWEKAQCPVQRR